MPIKLATINCHGQSGLDISKQMQIEAFIRDNNVDIANLQEVNCDSDTFNDGFLYSNFNLFENNAQNGYGVASLVKNHINVKECIRDTQGRAILLLVENNTVFGNVYPRSGTDNAAREDRENLFSFSIPTLFLSCPNIVKGSVSGDFNCITRASDATINPQSKTSPSLKRLIRVMDWSDADLQLAGTQKFTRFYQLNGINGASRLDRVYTFGGINAISIDYVPVSFSDHVAVVVELDLGANNIPESPRTRPRFKSTKSLIEDAAFGERLREMIPIWKRSLAAGMPMAEWWDKIFKSGIKTLMIQRATEMKRQARNELNIKQHRLMYSVKKLQQGCNIFLDEYNRVKTEIKQWYKDKAQDAADKMAVKQMDESETMNIFHHEQHKKKLKLSSILKLDTPEEGIIVGHEKCQKYLEKQLKNLLSPVAMDQVAQRNILENVKVVFDEEDRLFLSAEPTLNEVKEEVWGGNSFAAPGSDGIILYFYKYFWEDIHELLFNMIKDNRRRKGLTSSQKIALVVFGKKPKKGDSIKAKDLRRISLLNNDYKINSGLPTHRLSKLSIKGLSPGQYVSGADRRIQHCINNARDAVYKGNANNREGCGIQDNDFKAAFDLMMSVWPILVLLKKGCGQEFADWLAMFFTGVSSVVVVNNVVGAMIDLLRSLRQGDVISMLLFAYGLDPTLEELRSSLRGIRIYSSPLPVHGPVRPDEQPLPPEVAEERLTAFGYADDLKTAITTMQEFGIVDDKISQFERASGCELHRDPTSGKVKFLPLGRWRGTLQQEDLPLQCRYVALSDHLDMLGIPLYATVRKTEKASGDELQGKMKNTVGPWMTRFMCLTQRPWSVNTYLLPKAWHRCHTVPLRKCDIVGIKKQINRFVYVDQAIKPENFVNYRDRNCGGLQIHDVECKARALLSKSFMETAACTKYRKSLYHVAIYKYYILEERDMLDPGLPPYYNQQFINDIKAAIDLGLLVENMTAKDWYIFMLDRYVLKKSVEQDDGSFELESKLCRAETARPDLEWGVIWARARMRGLSNESRTFLWRMLHNLHPTKERLNRTMTRTNPTPICDRCDLNQVDNVQNHTFTGCTETVEAMTWLITQLRMLDVGVTAEKVVWLQFDVQNEHEELACVWLTAETLAYVWAKRRSRDPIQLASMRAILRARVEMMTKSNLYSNAAALLQDLTR